MASVRSQEASSSIPPCIYDVFLSFRGEDTRKTFTDHLYTALLCAGLRTFRDDDDIERGENVKIELGKAIKEARSSIIVFSKDYASSGWCLDELVMILERNRTSGHVILPIFYDVEPTQVREQTGSFAKAFGRHEERVKVETSESKEENLRKKVEGWRAALREIADLSGMPLQNQDDGHESKFIQKIVKVIEEKLNRGILHVAHYPIGMGSRVKNIDSWLRDESTDVGIAVICGMGGIGKTTIAKYVYDLHFHRFEGNSFLANVREESERPGGLVRLQRQLLSNILKRKEEKLSNEHEGIYKIKNVIVCKRVLVVLDDVDHLQQFENILGMRDWFHPGSKIIVTTRNKHLLMAKEIYIYEVKSLDFNQSLELFSKYAFGQEHPIEGYFHYSKQVVLHCSGHPLALKVLGSSLFGKTIDIWESTLQKIKVIPDKDIQKTLKISYDSLDDHDKNLFLYISYFFIGEDKDTTSRILHACGFYPPRGMDGLINRCLLTINGQQLKMHQLLRDMGREIVRQESPKEPGKRNLLGCNEDSFDVLRRKTGTETIEGLYFDMHVLERERLFNRTFGVSNTKRPHFDELGDRSLLEDEGSSLKRRCLNFLNWISINNVARNSNQVEFDTDTFTGMRNLKLLLLSGVEIKGGFKEFPKRLRWLSWHGFPKKFIPSDFTLECLVGLDLRYSKLKYVWKGTKLLESLEILNLSHSHGLTITPNFTGLSNLEDLILKDCTRLVEVHKSIGELRGLVYLNLEGCKNLKKLPSEIGHLTSLKKLILSGCSKLEQLPTELDKMKSLTVLHANGIAINRKQAATGEVKAWSWLLDPWLLKPIKSTKSIYFSLASLPCSLLNLRLSKCNVSNEDVTTILGTLLLLHDLDLSDNPISSLPKSIKALSSLHSLILNRTRLQSLPELPMSLKFLNVNRCRSLEMITNLPNQFTYLKFLASYCEKLVEVQGVFKLEPFEKVDPEIIKALGLVELKFIKNIEMEWLNLMSHTIRKSPLQGLYECGIYNIFLPEIGVPVGWYKSSKASSVSFTMPTHPNLKIRCLNLYVHYAFANDKSHADWEDYSTSFKYRGYFDFAYIIINNKTKDLIWNYQPTFKCIPPDKDMVWLSHWKIGHPLIECGDKVNVSVGLGTNFLVKEVGLGTWCYEHGEKSSQNDNIYHSFQNVINGGDLSVYRDGPRSYYLCNFYNELYQAYYR